MSARGFMDIQTRRRFFAEEIEAIANLRTPALVDALAAVPRERFLPPGPWFVRGDGDLIGGRQTPDADPSRVYHNYSIAIDAGRQLFNGAPSVVAGLIDALALQRGDRVLHVGAGTGYYSALIAHVVGAPGRVDATEVDPDLAFTAAGNLASMDWVQMHAGDSTMHLAGPYDAILVNAGVTHPQDVWLDALSDHGRLILPLTASTPQMGPLGKGVIVMVTRHGRDAYEARVLTFTSIYSGVNLRDASINQQLGQALMKMPFPRLQRLRRDPHTQGPACWLHGERFCFALD